MTTSLFATWSKRLKAWTRGGTPARRRGRRRAAPRLENLEDRLSPAAFNTQNLLVTVSDTLREYTTGTLVQSFTVPRGPAPADGPARDVIVGPAGQAHVYNGTFNPYLSTLDPVTGTWSHVTHAGWDTVNNVSYGGVARYGPCVFATDMATFHIQPLDNPAARVSLSQARGEYKKGTQDVKFPKYTRYRGDAADMARIIRGEKASDFPPEHDLAVQETLLRACNLPLKD